MSEAADWFDALAGAAPAAPAEQAEIAALRRASRRLAPATVDELAWRRLQRRLETEGLLADAPRRPSWTTGVARAAVVVLCLGLVLELARTPEPSMPGPAGPEALREIMQPAVAPEEEADAATPQDSLPLEGRRMREEENGRRLLAPPARAQDKPAAPPPGAESAEGAAGAEPLTESPHGQAQQSRSPRRVDTFGDRAAKGVLGFASKAPLPILKLRADSRVIVPALQKAAADHADIAIDTADETWGPACPAPCSAVLHCRSEAACEILNAILGDWTELRMVPDQPRQITIVAPQ